MSFSNQFFFLKGTPYDIGTYRVFVLPENDVARERGCCSNECAMRDVPTSLERNWKKTT